MNEIQMMLALFRASRERTLDLLQRIEQRRDPAAVLTWRPGPGRAHIGWQLMHIAVVEELFSTERLIPGSKAGFPELVARFKRDSTPDENVPPPEQIRELLGASRAHLEATLSKMGLEKLDEVPAPIAERGWTLRTCLQVLAWHEAHHQGQAHLTYNLYMAGKTDRGQAAP